MKNYIRTCLSLDEETIETINQLTWFEGMPDTKSGVIKKAIKFLYENTAVWKWKDKKNGNL